MKKIAFVVFTALLMLAMLTVLTVIRPAYALTTIDSYSESNQSSGRPITGIFDVSGRGAVGQAFTGTSGYNMTQARFYLAKIGSPVGNLVAVIYDITGTFGTNATPTGSALAISDSVAMSGIGSTYTLVNFTFSTPLTLVSQNYGVAVKCPDATTIDTTANYILVGLDDASPTHGGNYFNYFPSYWSGDASRDVCFYVNGVSTAGGDTTPPTYSSISVVAASDSSADPAAAGQNANFSITVADNANVSTVIFSTNMTGAWQNSTATLTWLNSTAASAKVTKTNNVAVLTTEAYQWYMNDTSNNWNSTSIYTMQTMYYNKTQFIMDFKSLCDAHSSVASYNSSGKTYNNNDIWTFYLGKGPAKLMVDGTIHGGEYFSGIELYYLANWLLTSGDAAASKILNDSTLIITPIINYDNWAGVRTNSNKTSSVRGVDLNRNFVYGWNSTAADWNGSDPSNWCYPGLFAASESETQAIRTLMNNTRSTVYINLHSGGGADATGTYDGGLVGWSDQIFGMAYNTACTTLYNQFVSQCQQEGIAYWNKYLDSWGGNSSAHPNGNAVDDAVYYFNASVAYTIETSHPDNHPQSAPYLKMQELRAMVIAFNNIYGTPTMKFTNSSGGTIFSLYTTSSQILLNITISGGQSPYSVTLYYNGKSFASNSSMTGTTWQYNWTVPNEWVGTRYTVVVTAMGTDSNGKQFSAEPYFIIDPPTEATSSISTETIAVLLTSLTTSVLAIALLRKARKILVH